MTDDRTPYALHGRAFPPHADKGDIKKELTSGLIRLFIYACWARICYAEGGNSLLGRSDICQHACCTSGQRNANGRPWLIHNVHNNMHVPASRAIMRSAGPAFQTGTPLMSLEGETSHLCDPLNHECAVTDYSDCNCCNCNR